MAKKTLVMRVCDLHTGNVEADKTVTMSWNGRSYDSISATSTSPSSTPPSASGRAGHGHRHEPRVAPAKQWPRSGPPVQQSGRPASVVGRRQQRPDPSVGAERWLPSQHSRSDPRRGSRSISGCQQVTSTPLVESARVTTRSVGGRGRSPTGCPGTRSSTSESRSGVNGLPASAEIGSVTMQTWSLPSSSRVVRRTTIRFGQRARIGTPSAPVSQSHRLNLSTSSPVSVPKARQVAVAVIKEVHREVFRQQGHPAGVVGLREPHRVTRRAGCCTATGSRPGSLPARRRRRRSPPSSAHPAGSSTS